MCPALTQPNPRGPGGFGRDFMKRLGKHFREDLGDDYDIFGFDPRGLSLPLANYPDIDSNRLRYWTYHSCRKYFWKRRTLSSCMGCEGPGYGDTPHLNQITDALPRAIAARKALQRPYCRESPPFWHIILTRPSSAPRGVLFCSSSKLMGKTP